MTQKPEKIPWSFQCDFKYRYHIEPRGQLYGPKEEAFPVPLKYDVTTDRDYEEFPPLYTIPEVWTQMMHKTLERYWTDS